MSALASAFVAVLIQLLPLVSGAASGGASTITTIINALIQLIPLAVQEASDLLPEIKNVIAAVSASPAATTDQLATLQTLDTQVDAAFEAAATAAGDPAP